MHREGTCSQSLLQEERAVDERPSSLGSLLTSVYPSVKWRVLFYEVIHSRSALCLDMCWVLWILGTLRHMAGGLGRGAFCLQT